jgi:glycosyltransferase involved in cell wall biosynthesis
MRILEVTPYPPARDGIASYAVQEVRALRRAGHEVEVLSPSPSAAHHHLDFANPRAIPALARRLRAYDQVIVQFFPGLFYRSEDRNARALVNTALTAAFRWGRNVTLRIHEWDGPPLGDDPVRDRVTREMFLSARSIEVHAESQRRAFCQHFRIPPARVSVCRHGEHFVERTALGREQARARLGVGNDEFMFLCIGFIQRHKGFDRAVRAFSGLGAHGCRLDIVGSVRVDAEELVSYRNALRSLVAGEPGVRLHEGYVGDATFDAWIVASDVVVLPYREIWSSGVLERAALLGRQVVCTRVGALEEQAPAGTIFVDDDEGLARVFAELAPVRRRPTLVRSIDARPDDAPVDLAEVMALIRSRAAAARGAARTDPETAAGIVPMMRVEPLALPSPDSPRRSVRIGKRIVRRLTAWQVDPIVEQLNALRGAVLEAAEASASGSWVSDGR